MKGYLSKEENRYRTQLIELCQQIVNEFIAEDTGEITVSNEAQDAEEVCEECGELIDDCTCDEQVGMNDEDDKE
jgi:phosphoribosyl-ATP pyrophosphohydrolase